MFLPLVILKHLLLVLHLTKHHLQLQHQILLMLALLKNRILPLLLLFLLLPIFAPPHPSILAAPAALSFTSPIALAPSFSPFYTSDILPVLPATPPSITCFSVAPPQATLVAPPTTGTHAFNFSYYSSPASPPDLANSPRSSSPPLLFLLNLLYQSSNKSSPSPLPLSTPSFCLPSCSFCGILYCFSSCSSSCCYCPLWKRQISLLLCFNGAHNDTLRSDSPPL